MTRHSHDAHDHQHPGDHHGSHNAAARIITVRPASGLSGDIMLAGLAALGGLDNARLAALTEELNLPALQGCVRLEPRSVNHVAGFGCHIDLPHEHEHRTLADILTIIDASRMPERAKEAAVRAFRLLAEAEGAVHGIAPESVSFHEVGALDSILDICMVCALFERLSPDLFVCSPLPMGDGGVQCAHGWIPTPAPAVLELLEGIAVCGFAGRGETVTPTAVALLRTLGAQFGPWPAMVVERRALVYGDRVFENAPNGAVFAMGRGLPESMA